MPDPTNDSEAKEGNTSEVNSGTGDNQGQEGAISEEDLKDLDPSTLQSLNPKLYQRIYKEGHKKAMNSSQSEIAQLKERLETMEGYVNSNDNASPGAGSGGDGNAGGDQQGNSGGFDKQKYEDALLKARQQVEDMKNSLEERKKSIVIKDVERRADSMLGEMGITDADIRSSILVPKIMGRVEIDGEDEISALDTDGVTPLTGGLDALVKSVFDGAKDHWKDSKVSQGPSLGSNANNNGASATFLSENGASDQDTMILEKAVKEGKKAAQSRQNLSKSLSFE